MLDHYLHTATTAAEQLYPTVRRVPLGDPRMGTSVRSARDRDEALNWFTREQTTLLDLVNYGSDEHTWRLAATMGPYLEGRGYWHDREDTARTGVAAATRLENPTALAFSHGSLASAYLQYPTPGSYMVAGGSQHAARSSRLEAANTHLRHAIDSFLRADDLIGLAFTYIQVCCLHEERGQFQEALKAARQALDAFADADDPLGQAFATNATGLYLAKLGDYEQALPMCEQAAAQLEELGNHDGWAATCDSLGYTHHKLGNYTVTVGCYDRTIEHFRTVGHRYSEAYSTIGLGDTFNTAGDIPAARAAWQRAFDILTEINHPDAQYVSDMLTASADTSGGGVTSAPSDR